MQMYEIYDIRANKNGEFLLYFHRLAKKRTKFRRDNRNLEKRQLPRGGWRNA